MRLTWKESQNSSRANELLDLQNSPIPSPQRPQARSAISYESSIGISTIEHFTLLILM